MDFREWLTHNEGMFDFFKKPEKPAWENRPRALPSRLAYHIADAINDAMRAVGKMPPQEKHNVPGRSGGSQAGYDASLKQKIRDKYYGIARQMWEKGDTHGIQSYFGYSIGEDGIGGRYKSFGGAPAEGKGRFLQDVIDDVEKEAGIAPAYEPVQMPAARFA